MSVSRRKFLRSAAVVSTALVLKPGTFILGQDSTWSNTIQSSGAMSPRSYSREMFEPYVGDVFRVRVGKQMVDLKLVALENIKPASRGITTGKIARTDCFSMRFHAMTRLPANANTHNLNHGKLGSFDLFMTQSRKGTKFLQTAIVNQVV
jgi:hypothetical protein